MSDSCSVVAGQEGKGMGPLGGLVLLYSTGFLRYAKLANVYASPPGAKAFGYGKGFTRFSDIGARPKRGGMRVF